MLIKYLFIISAIFFSLRTILSSLKYGFVRHISFIIEMGLNFLSKCPVLNEFPVYGRVFRRSHFKYLLLDYFLSINYFNKNRLGLPLEETLTVCSKEPPAICKMLEVLPSHRRYNIFLLKAQLLVTVLMQNILRILKN